MLFQGSLQRYSLPPFAAEVQEWYTLGYTGLVSLVTRGGLSEDVQLQVCYHTYKVPCHMSTHALIPLPRPQFAPCVVDVLHHSHMSKIRTNLQSCDVVMRPKLKHDIVWLPAPPP